ncbi:PorT family protein [Inquilinus sp. KBS0705]|nr:PorT family protein [Inquilinus sp. KBS0705]
MKYFYTLLIFSLIPSFLLAQRNYKPGYIVSLSGDTIKGSIDYREWDNNPKSITFKSIGKAEGKYAVNNIKAFGVDKAEYFERFVTIVSQNPVGVGNITVQAEIKNLTDTLFLKIISKGSKVTLYTYTDKIKTRYYIAESGANAEELIYGQYLDSENSERINTVNRFRVQLQSLAQMHDPNNSKLAKGIAVSSYTESDLIKIAKAINGSTNLQLSSENVFGIRFFAGAGTSINKFTIDFNGFFPAGTSQSKVSPLITAGVDFLINKNTQRFYIRVEASVISSTYSFNDIEAPAAANTTLGTRSTLNNLKQTNIALTPQLIYNYYSADNLQLFIGSGFALNIPQYGKHSLTTTSPNYTNTKADFPEFKKLWFSFPIKAGATINKKIQLYADYMLAPSRLDDYASIGSTLSQYQLGVNYLF